MWGKDIPEIIHTWVSSLEGSPELKTYCFDCECIVDPGLPLCVGCERHRLDGHLAELGDFEPECLEEGEVPGWCHGAGPEGLNVDRLTLSPYPLRWDQTWAYSVRPRPRRSRRRPVVESDI